MNICPLVKHLTSLSAALLISSCAAADHGHRHGHHHDRHTHVIYESDSQYGRVLDARPVYRQVVVEVPSQSCRVHTVAHEQHRRNGDSFTGTVVGGLVGAAIGHELGNGRGAATAAGGLIGATIGNDAASSHSRHVKYYDEEVCSTRYHTEYENRLIGYDVSYSYRGRIYQTRTDRHPGDSIEIESDRRRYRD